MRFVRDRQRKNNEHMRRTGSGKKGQAKTETEEVSGGHGHRIK